MKKFNLKLGGEVNAIVRSALAIVPVAVMVGSLLLPLSGCTRKTVKDPAGTLYIPLDAKINGLDPAFADDEYAGREVSRAYESLFQYHYLKRPYVLIPNLAEVMPQVGADGRTLTIRLKKGVLFQDDRCFKETGGKGRELVAEDVIYSFKRLADPRLVSTGWWILDGKIVGLNEWREEAAKTATDYTKSVAGLKTLDRYTLQIILKKSSSQFFYSLALPLSAVVAREAVEFYGDEFHHHPVGTGPFRLTQYIPGSKLIWDRNPTYRKEYYPSEGTADDASKGLLADAGRELPLASRLVVQIYEEWQPMWLNFMSGKLDLSGIPKDNYDQAVGPDGELTAALKEKGITLSKAPMADVVRITFNMADPLIGKNKYLRQALSIAFDGTDLIRLFYNGRAIPAQGPIPPGLAGYDPDFRNPYRVSNLGKARELLAKAGFPQGKGLPSLEFLTVSATHDRQMAEFAQKVFGAIGVKLRVSAYSWPEFQAAMRARRGQLWSFAWRADYPDSENFLQLFYSKNASPGPNDANYSNPEYDRLYEKALSLVDSPERTALYRRMVDLLVEDCPWIFTVHRMSYRLSQSWTKNYKYHDFSRGMEKYYRVDPALRK